MSLAAETREPVRARPAPYAVPRPRVVNYTAAAETLAIDGDCEAIATALRRFAESLPSPENTTSETTDSPVTVRMESGIDCDSVADALLAVDGVKFDADTADTQSAAANEHSSLTAIHATGAVDSDMLATVLDRLRIADITTQAAGIRNNSLVVVVPRSSGSQTLRAVEAVVSSTV